MTWTLRSDLEPAIFVSLHTSRESWQTDQCLKHAVDHRIRIVLRPAVSYDIETWNLGCPEFVTSLGSARELVAAGRPAQNRRVPLFVSAAPSDSAGSLTLLAVSHRQNQPTGTPSQSDSTLSRFD